MAPWQDCLYQAPLADCSRVLLETGREDIVFVAPKRAKNFRALLAGLDLLRREGIAEPD